MDNELFELIKYISIESLCIAVIAFALTMLIKWPIKKFTSKLSEEKRRAVNIVIMFIPGLISVIISLFYYGIFKSNWATMSILNTGLSAWIISLTIYAIYERIVTIIKAIKSGKLEINSELASETINYLKSNLKNLNSSLKEKEKTLKNISDKLKSLNQIKIILESNVSNKDIAKLSDTNIEIQKMTNEENILQSEINETKSQIKNYTAKLYVKKGE